MKRMFGACWRLLLALTLVFTATAATAPGTAQAVDYPGGKRIYAVTIGGIHPDSTGNQSFARLAMYYFNGNGTVTESFWFWDWGIGYPHANIKPTSAGCVGKACEIHTSGGFQAGALTKSLNGTYTNDGTQVVITWDGGQTETWAVGKPTAKLSSIGLRSSSYGATVGQGYGSNAPHDTFVPLNKVPRHKYLGRQNSITYVVKTGKIETDTGTSIMDLTSTAWKQCNGDCLSAGLPVGSPEACSACKPGETRAIRYYLASEGGRKNYYEHHCTCLRATGSDCYDGGSHVKPQLQVIDDDGVLHGWVGVEASNRQAKRGTLGVHWHTDV
ncbi:hypothetical protein [Crossiella sp. CA198]|uniref:hypothetical protein n=1 Tax=Crossiella sp. CA198 TaxID=3455607 RepID=UPI003F8D8B2A